MATKIKAVSVAFEIWIQFVQEGKMPKLFSVYVHTLLLVHLSQTLQTILIGENKNKNMRFPLQLGSSE